MPPKPYIGVTGFAHRDEVLSVLNTLPNPDRLIMVGVGVRDAVHSTRGPNRYPACDMLGQIFIAHPNALNLLHVSIDSRDGAWLLDNLFFLYQIAGPYCHGFQFNIPWLSERVLEEFTAVFPHVTIVLGCGRDALRKTQGSYRNLARRLRDYVGLIDYVGIDSSGGAAKELNAATVLHAFDQIAEAMPDLGLVAMGGLHSGNAERKLSPILARHDVSCDAEGKLRVSNDLLDVAECVRYIKTVDALFRHFETVRVQSL